MAKCVNATCFITYVVIFLILTETSRGNVEMVPCMEGRVAYVPPQGVCFNNECTQECKLVRGYRSGKCEVVKLRHGANVCKCYGCVKKA